MALLLLPAILLAAPAGDASPTLFSSPAARIAEAGSTPELNPRLAALADVGKTLALAEIPEALRQADQLKSLRERVVLTASVLKRWGELAPVEAFTYVAEMPEGVMKLESLRGVLPSLFVKNPSAVAKAAVALKPGRTRNEAVLMLAEIMANDDAQAAIRWVTDLPEGFPKDAALRNIHFIRARQDPAGMAPVVAKLPDGATKNALIMNVAGNWVARDADGALQWAESLPSEPERHLALVTVAEAWADIAPAAAAEFARKLPTPELRQRAVSAALERWATQDPRQAFEWAANLSEAALASVLNVYATTAPEESACKVRELPPGPLRESAIATHAETACQWNPEIATRLASETLNPEARRNLVGKCFKIWLAWDPAAARQWLGEADFPETMKHAWLEFKPEPEI